MAKARDLKLAVNTTLRHDINNTIDNARLRSLLYTRDELAWYEEFSRFGALDPYNKLQTTRDYLFFTKPDLHLLDKADKSDDSTIIGGLYKLQPALSDDAFFIDMANRYPNVLLQLQHSAKCGNPDMDDSPFMNILTNGVTNSLDIDNITAAEMDNATNVFGSSISYRKDGWTSDEGFDFTLEFEDSKFLEIYHLAKIYEEYFRKYPLGTIYPPNQFGETCKASSNGAIFNNYIKNKELHERFAVWRFVVDEDMESIIYWAYVCGAYINNVPREAFNDISGNTGLKLTLDFKSFYVEDCNPLSLVHFNRLINSSYGYMNGLNSIDPSQIASVYDSNFGGVDTRWVKHPYIIKVNASTNQDTSWYGSKDMGYKYKLVWIKK